jgi:hypothetical protein
MPPKKSRLQQEQSRMKGLETIAQKRTALGSETAADDLWDQLQVALSRNKELEQQLSLKSLECESLYSKLETFRQKCIQLTDEVFHWRSKQEVTYHSLRMERQRAKRGSAKIDRLEQQKEILVNAEKNVSACLSERSKNSEQALLLLKKANNGLQMELSDSMARWTSQLDKTRSKLEMANSKLAALQKEASRLRKSVARASGVKDRAVAAAKAKVKKETTTHHMMNKGVFTEETRNVVRLLVKAGCSRKYVNEVISSVLQSAGINPVGSISRTTVARVVREGYFAAQIQLGYEMANTKSMTFSADGTGHRGINFNSRHVHLIAEDYTSPSPGTAKKRATRFLGIQSSRDGSSEEAMIDWENTLKKIIDLYNGSPFGKRVGGLVKFIELLIKLVGMNTDHCAKEKKDARLLEELKAWAVDQHLGEEAMLGLSMEEINELYSKAHKEMIKSAGGQSKWNALSENAKADKRAKMVEGILEKLGKEAFEDLEENEQRFLRLFIWAGCGCHKDLNTVRGGYTAMSALWDVLELPGPVLLANRDNDPVIQERTTALKEGDVPTLAQQRAFEKSARGAIKTAEIAGAIFNHKDNKKGHHDVFRFWWWEHVGTPFTFPDTSNNRFQSYCDAAAALILYRDVFIEFLEHLRINKQNSRLNHMEQNLWNALHCEATLAEFAVLAIYAESVSYPYMKSIRTSRDKDQNMLDLGPLHQCVYKHMQKIIDNPDILIGASSSHLTASLNGDEWQNSNVVSKVLEIAQQLPYFKDLLVAFFTGAANTWERFTSEFAEGGLIDEATAEERDLAWLPAVNDENEGALGSFRQLMSRQPQLTLLNHNALAMFYKNNTQAFMAAKFTEPEDYKYLHMLARESQGEEKQRRKEIVEFRDIRQAKKTAQKEKRDKTARDKAERLAGLELILDKEEVMKLRGVRLGDQLKLFKQAGAPNLVNCALPTTANKKREALSEAVDLYLNGTWKIGEDGSNDSDEEEFPDIDSDGDWTDED